MNKFYFFLCLLIVHQISITQNLVSNPSFEIYKDCPKGISFFHRNVIDWRIPNNGTTDYFNDCSISEGFSNSFGSQKPKSGLGYAGFYAYVKKNYREYISGRIIERLEKGKAYKISFYVSLSENSAYAVKNFGILFYANKPRISFESKPILAEELSKSNPRLSFFSMETKEYLRNGYEWEKVEKIYTANGTESFFTIGNFSTNRKTKKLKVRSPKGPNDSYYYIDDVSIEPLIKEKPQIAEVSKRLKEEVIKTNKVYTFKDVLFDFDKSDLLDISIKELNQLYEYLNTNLDLSIEIYGHSDSKGLDKRNKELSQERAKAVADYLISQGLSISRITSFGFGSSKPISSNDTEEGRKLNRRVEFKLIKN